MNNYVIVVIIVIPISAYNLKGGHRLYSGNMSKDIQDHVILKLWPSCLIVLTC